MRRVVLPAALLVLLTIGVASCGDGGEEKAKAAAGKAACTALGPGATGAASDAVSLPTGFPTEQDVTFVSTTTAGPTSITTGSSTARLDAVFKAYKADLSKAPYSVTKSEKDEHDAEVNFASGDTTGQVKLQECDGGKLAVQVTARPK